jgi:4-carboxymuconolactone decarboxylase
MPDRATDTPLLDLLAEMTASSVEASALDGKSLMLVRVAALVAVDAPPISYAVNLDFARDAGVDAEQLRAVLMAVAPIVGTARIASATTNIAEALDVEI